jgi:hypothetical protein
MADFAALSAARLRRWNAGNNRSELATDFLPDAITQPTGCQANKRPCGLDQRDEMKKAHRLDGL